MATAAHQEEELTNTQPVDDTVLKNVVAYVEVRSTNDNRSEAVRQVLGKLGATVVKKFTNDVTHVIYKEGSNRTKTKAQKMGIHLVSVLWVESCRQNEAHVSERMYPAVVPKQKDSRLIFATKLKKAKSMQPRDFEEDLANSAERLRRKKKRVAAISRLCASETTPYSSPRSPMILVQDTQPRTPEDGYILTPFRLTIPDTPPSMREKMKQLLLAKQAGAGSDTGADTDNDDDGVSGGEPDPLQRKLFKSSAVSCEFSSPGSPNNSSVFLSDHNNTTIEEVPHNTSDTSVTDDILNIASKINATMSHQARRYSNMHTPSQDSVLDKVMSTQTKRFSNIHTPLQESTRKKMSSSRETETPHTSITPEENVKSPPVLALLNENDTTKHTDETVKLEPTENDRKTSNRKTRVSSVSFRKGEKLVPRRNPRRSSVLPAIILLDDEINKDSASEITSQPASRGSDEHNNVDNFEDEDPIPKAFDKENVGPKINESESKKAEMSTDNISSKAKTSKSRHVEETNVSLDNSENLAQSSGKSQSPLSVNLDVSRPNVNDTNIKIQVRKSRRTSCRVKSFQEETHTAKDSNTENNSCSIGAVTNGQNVKEKKSTRNDSKESENTLTKIKAKPTMKKKLLSLTDLNEQHSVLMEPTKCSQVKRKQLIEDSVKKEEKKKKKTKETLLANDNDTIKTKGRKSISRKRKSNSTSGGSTSDETVSQPKQRDVSVSVFENDENQTASTQKKSVDILVNDSMVEDKYLTISQRNTTHLQDLTTQLNLTRDNTLQSSAREKALSSSMSMAYTDTTLPSFLQPRRESIDEFSASQKTQRKKKVMKKSVLSTVEENKPCDKLISVSDMSSRLSLMKFIETTTHRKNIRPSIVMTSLHSHEQDVVIAVAKKLGGFVISECVNETTTHVVCGESRRTLNVLQCLARGIWLLTKEWVIKSLEADHWIPEHEFECFDLFPTCKIAREEREACIGIYRQHWLKSMGPIYVSGRASPPRPHLVQLIKLCGGQVTGTLSKARVYVGADLHPGITCVKTPWLLDSITEHQLLAIEPYSLDRPKRESSPVY